MEKEIIREDDEVPPGKKRRKFTVGIIYNIKHDSIEKHSDDEAEFDSIETINSIKQALESKSVAVTLIEADNFLVNNLLKTPIDIAFNIAEGKGGRSREAQAPVILDMQNIPFTGSEAGTLCLALDKEWCKRFLGCYDIISPLSCKLDSSENEFIKMKFPVIVKPNAEGSSKGIHGINVFNNLEELEKYINSGIDISGFIAEEYIKGQEFTVSVLGNGEDITVFEPLEIVFDKVEKGGYNVYNFEVKKDFKNHIHYECPGRLSKKLSNEMKNTAKKIYRCMDCKDFARMDFRVTEDGQIYFIEINPLPGLAPDYSDFPMNLEMCGVSYTKAVRSILSAALKRYGMKKVY